jgi:DNA polymerase alpha subunit A
MMAPGGVNLDIEQVRESDGSLRFYLLDVYEEGSGTGSSARRGQLFLTGKVFNRRTGLHESCGIVIEESFRDLYFHRREGSTEAALAEEVKNSILKRFVRDLPDGFWNGAHQKYRYAFELEGIPRGQTDFYHVTYSFRYAAPPADVRGDHFTHMIGSTYTVTELFLLQNCIKGPQWLVVLPNAYQLAKDNTHCKFELRIKNADEDSILTLKDNIPPPPPLLAVSIAIKTCKNSRAQHQRGEVELVQATLSYHSMVQIDQ